MFGFNSQKSAKPKMNEKSPILLGKFLQFKKLTKNISNYNFYLIVNTNNNHYNHTTLCIEQSLKIS
jgi:hypothetical protein